MIEDQKIIITVTTANSLVYPEVKNWAINDEELIEDVVECYETGAAVAHIHLPEARKLKRLKKYEIDVISLSRRECQVSQL